MIADRLIESIKDTPGYEARPFEFRMSASGECVRKIEQQIVQGIRANDPVSILRMESGHALHKMIQDMVSKALGTDFHSAEKEVEFTTIEGVKVSGHPDGVIDSLDAVLEIKTVSSATFAKIVKESKPLDQHIEQTNSYAMVMCRANCLILYFDRDSCEFKEFYFDADPDLYSQTKSKFDQAKRNATSGNLSPRPYHDKTESPCWYCEFKDACYANFNSEINGLGSSHCNDEEVKVSMFVANASRTVRLHNEKQEEEHKSILKKKMVDLGLKVATVLHEEKKLKATLSPGKNSNLLIKIEEIK